MRFRFPLAACGLLLALALPAWAARPPALRPNLRGEVMILVYHNFGKEARWGRSFANFDRDLERLDAAGYRPITLRQYTTGEFTLPEGTTPVVLTFDDGSKYQVRFTPQGAVAPDCALAHWMAFAKTHPEFPVRGTFFVNPGTDVFAQRAFIQPKLHLLLQLGAEIGNHTYDHPNLRKLTPAQAAREIGMGQYFLRKWLPAYPITSFALPYGVGPTPYGLAAAGTWTGTVGRQAVTVEWHYSAVVLVGSGPAASPLVAGLNRARLPRIQVFHPEFSHWMNYFARHPQWRFISDGRPHAAGSLPAR